MKIHDHEWSFDLKAKISGFLQRVRRRHPQLDDDLEQLRALKAIVEGEECLGCKQKSLELVDFVESPSGWEAKIACSNCNFECFSNSLGVKANQINSKGKARP